MTEIIEIYVINMNVSVDIFFKENEMTLKLLEIIKFIYSQK